MMRWIIIVAAILVMIYVTSREIKSYRLMKKTIANAYNNGHIKKGVLYVYNRSSILSFPISVQLKINDGYSSTALTPSKLFAIPASKGTIVYDSKLKKAPKYAAEMIEIENYDAKSIYIYQVIATGLFRARTTFRQITEVELENILKENKEDK